MRRFNRILVVVLVVLLSFLQTGCYSSNLVSSSEEFHHQNINRLSDIEMSSIEASNILGFKLLKEQVKKDGEGNIVLSPLSLSFALAMLQEGAIDISKEEILTVMGEDEELLSSRYNNITNYIHSLRLEDKLNIELSNSIWFREEVKPVSTYVDTLKEYYDAEVFSQDFTSSDAVENMNQWVDKKSHGLLKNIFKEVDADAVIYLMNMLYFKGEWIDEFDKEDTYQETFFISKEREVKVDMMRKVSKLLYYEDEVYKITMLPLYSGLEFVIILPTGSIMDFFNQTSIEELSEIVSMSHAKVEKVSLCLPKFDYQVNYELNKFLRNQGLTSIFSPTRARLDQIVKDSYKLYVSKVSQHTRIIVDEESAEAASLTVIEAPTEAAPPREDEKPKVIKCDHPFIFAIRDGDSGLTFFMGTIKNPNKH